MFYIINRQCVYIVNSIVDQKLSELLMKKKIFVGLFNVFRVVGDPDHIFDMSTSKLILSYISLFMEIGK